jgi:hypothetical protein
MINFKLKDINHIDPIGQEPELYLSWFWLTDGEIWLKFGDQTVYEYSKEAMQHFGNKRSPYNDYYIVRFLKDFTELFKTISISIPANLFDLTENLNIFSKDAHKWLDIYDTDEDEYPDFYFNEYDKLKSWIYDRHFNSGHLKGGPHLFFFRHKNKIRIVWKTEHTLDNGIKIWTANDGNLVINFSDFVSKVKAFGLKFFEAMDKQVELTLKKDWEHIKVDKSRLIEEHKERQIEFIENISFLERSDNNKTNWTEIEALIKRMRKEIK